MPPQAEQKKYYPALDGLRGLAILMVVIMHNFRFMNYFFFGWLGVDLFFVISGFLITDILLNTAGKPHYLRNFYMRRVIRIFPVFYVAMAVCLFVIPVFFKELNITYYRENQVYLWTYLQNWLFIFRPPYGDPILLHSWSLAVEEQFYIFWPLIILLVKDPKRLLVISCFLLLAVAITRYLIWINQIESLSYSSLYTFTRIDGICIGAMIALLFRISPSWLKKNTTWIVLLMAAINLGFYLINNSQSFSLPYRAFVGYTTFAVLFGVLLYETVMNKSPIIRFLFDNSFMRFFGKISYGFYVYHWPITLIMLPAIMSWMKEHFKWGGDLYLYLGSTIVTLVAISVSYISYRFFEKPLLQLKKKYN
jgi:peptidoglycan/LPS O-acetylase OafA/YrhL